MAEQVHGRFYVGLLALGVALPLKQDEVGSLVDATDEEVLVVDNDNQLPDERTEAIATLIAEAVNEADRLHSQLNSPEIEDFAYGVVLEAAHQRERWKADHDAGKSPFDWFWLIAYLAQKAAAASVAGDVDKAKHHTISTAAALANWHLALGGGDNGMRPGIEPPTVGTGA